MTFVAVDGVVIEPQGIVSGGTLSIASAPSSKIRTGGQGVYSGALTFSVSGANATGYDPGTVATVGPATIPATAVKVMADGAFVVRVGDSVVANMTGLVGGTATPFVEPWEITDAGQDKVRGE